MMSRRRTDVRFCFKPYALCVVLVLVTGMAKQPVFADSVIDAGRGTFIDACSTCHGVFGYGDGIVADMLNTAPANLTLLSKNNKGVFPWRKVYDVIDGRNQKADHGQRDMPIWGQVWEQSVPPEYKKDAEVFVRGRILELMLFLESIQKQ